MINFKLASLEAELINIVRPIGKSIPVKTGENVRAQVVDILPNGGAVLRFKGQLVEIQSEIPLQKGTQLLLQILPTPEKGILKLKIVQILNKQAQNLQTSLNNLVSSLNFKPLNSNITELNKNILNQIKSNISYNWHFSALQLKELIQNSGVLYETKIKNKKQVETDLKFKLLTILQDSNISPKEKEKVKQIVKQIENLQHLSKITGSFWTFLPVIWDDLINSNFVYKKFYKKNIEIHFIGLNFEFEKLGTLNVNIFYFLKNLNIFFSTENKEFLAKLKENIQNLQNKIKEYNTNFVFTSKIKKIEQILDESFDNLVKIKA